MKLEKHDVPGVSQTSASVMNGEESRQSVRRRPAGLTSRVREIDCLLADIQAQIGMLGQERTYLGLVREELAHEDIGQYENQEENCVNDDTIFLC